MHISVNGLIYLTSAMPVGLDPAELNEGWSVESTAMLCPDETGSTLQLRVQTLAEACRDGHGEEAKRFCPLNGDRYG